MSGDRLRELVGLASPGPWRCDGDWAVLCPDSEHVGGRAVAVTGQTTATVGQGEADARLIALAPDLALLCADMGDVLADIGPHHPHCDAHWNRACDCGEQLAMLLARLASLQPEETA